MLILYLIVAYPVATAFSLYQVFRFAAEPAPKFWLFLYGFIFMLCCHFFFVVEQQNQPPRYEVGWIALLGDHFL
jgi:uncharacterized BrkB/YihY/UPF0761 family membrane protein